MGLQRFRTFDEARRALWVEPGDPELGRRIRRLWAFASRLAPGAPPRGLRFFRDVEEAGLERDRWEKERVLRLRSTRGA